MVKNGNRKWKINCDRSQSCSKWISVEYVRNVCVSMVTIEAWLLSNAEDDVSQNLLAGMLCTSVSPNLTLLGVYILYARMDYCPARARGTSLF